MASRYNSSTGMNTRRAMTTSGRGTRRRNVARPRGNMTGNGPSTRMARGRAASGFIANSNNNRIMAQNPGRGSRINRNIGQSVGQRAAKIPADYTPMRIERTDFKGKGQSRYRTVYCPKGQNTYTHQCVEAPQGASTSYIAQTSGVRSTTGRSMSSRRPTMAARRTMNTGRGRRSSGY